MPTPELKQAGEAVKIPPSRNNLPPKLYFFSAWTVRTTGSKNNRESTRIRLEGFLCLVSKLVMVLEISIFG